jgi:SAM-dependent methyltransferase
MKATWEDQISLSPCSDYVPERIGPPSAHVSSIVNPRFKDLKYADALVADHYDLPGAAAREGYYGDRHFDYWLSGLKDSSDLLTLSAEFGDGSPSHYLDLGGASGRVARHMALAHTVPEVTVADINREHVNFVTSVFDGHVRAFQCNSIPHLPLEDRSLDLISAYSVFSHIETFDDAWISELRRLLRPGGLLALTANIDNFHRVDDTWPLYKSLIKHPQFDHSSLGEKIKSDRMVFRWSNQISYSSFVFLSEDYVKRRWAPWFSSFKIIHGMLPFQTMLILRR